MLSRTDLLTRNRARRVMYGRPCNVVPWLYSYISVTHDMGFTPAAAAVSADAGCPTCSISALLSTGSTGILKRSSQPVALVGGSGFSKPTSVDVVFGRLLSDDIDDSARAPSSNASYREADIIGCTKYARLENDG